LKLLQQISRTTLLANAVLALGCVSFASAAKETTAQPNIERGFQQMYNLDFPNAHTTFQAYQEAHPEEAIGYVSNAAAYLFSEFDRLHILESDLFTDDQKFEHRDKVSADPVVKTQF
jgi:hypothetical protein